jgi:phage terminase large subunit-like protein
MGLKASSLSSEQRAELLESLTDEEAALLLHDWHFWCRDTQQEPEGLDWTTWLILAGRGFGKTRTGAETVRGWVESGRYRRIALVAETAGDARDVMVEGESGILACSPPWNRPKYEPSKRRLTWPNGARATLYSGEEPDQLRGPQHDAAWSDEIAKWRYAQDAWDQLQFGLRLGDRPIQIVTTTPRPTKALTVLKAEAGCVVTHAGTAENAAHLSPGFLDELLDLYGGTRRAAQELEGRIVEIDGALFTATMMADARGEGRQDEGGNGGVSPLDLHPSSLEHIVVAIDPTASLGGDACGIVAAGVRTDADRVRRAVVLADRSARGGSASALLMRIRSAISISTRARNSGVA